jgi:hypothetical protein
MTRFAVLVSLVLMSVVGLQPSAHAADAPPVVEVERAWRVQKGAALEVAYTIACPDRTDSSYQHAMWTNGDYLEFRCSPQPQRVVQLLPGPVSKGERLSLDTRVVSPECMYADFTDPDFPIPGCRVVDSTDELRIKAGPFETEDAAGRGGKAVVTRVRAARDGGVRLVARFSCTRPLEGWVPYQVSQVTRSGYTSAGDGGGDRYVSCTPGDPQRVRWVARPAAGDPSFAFGRRVVVTLDWAFDYEGGQWDYYSGLLQVRRAPSPPSPPS